MLLTASLKKALLPLLPALPLLTLPPLLLLLVISWVAVSATVKGSYLQVHTKQMLRETAHIRYRTSTCCHSWLPTCTTCGT